MSLLKVRLSKLEAAAGIGADPLDRLWREIEAKPDAELLQGLALVRAWRDGTSEPETSIEVRRWVERLAALMAESAM